jgi:hypothetical protein
MKKRELPLSCPSCEKQLQVTHMQCPNCEIKIEGTYSIPALMNLSKEETFLMLEFVKNNGSLKQLSKIMNLSYPAIRSRLDKLIQRLEEL